MRSSYAARCLKYSGTWTKSDDLLILLGKTSLHSMNEYEKVIKVKKHIIHENYTIDGSENDIAIIILEEPVVFIEGIQPACIGFEDYEESLTTGWAADGDLTPISLYTDGNEKCIGSNGNSTYCAVYGNDIGVCPSYGGIHAARHANTWHLHGIRYADPSDRGPCFDNTVIYTDINSYIDWIVKYIN
ncbi:unnamed protein product [Euphydryas editha]|uniref:Peptidase S1 domain-containing protein n=1 Tax=Euphydryas editha TaxID=104508 RepID=A0AAU9UFF4_EUPED|nr:unnamed protein product [Euphydryas editha]